jgi:hypothetical protein
VWQKLITTILFPPVMNSRNRNKLEKLYRFEGKTGTYVFSPQDINLTDDAYHGSKTLQFTEWWYFDAVLNDGYSIQFSVRVLSGLKLSFVFVRFDVYKDGHLQVHKRKMYLLRDIMLSRELPLIKVAGKQIMKGSFDKKTGNFIYDISLETDEVTASLQFIGCTKGWKGQHYEGDWWAVVLPQATVSGKITLHDKEISVQGTGYHDHNWNVQIFALKNEGWFWGRLNSETFSINWAAIMPTPSLVHPLLIINEKNKGYLNIEPKDIHFTPGDLRKENKILIPHAFTLNTESTPAVLQVTMETVDIHYVRIFPFMRYWRYHVKCTGSISSESKKELINNVFIGEFLKIR